MADCGERAGEDEALEIPGPSRRGEHMVVLRAAPVVHLLRRFTVVSDCRAGVEHRAAPCERFVVAAALEQLAAKQLDLATKLAIFVERGQMVDLRRIVQIPDAGVDAVALRQQIVDDPRADIPARAGDGDGTVGG